MQRTLIKCALLGGIIAFAWAILSWTAIGWQRQSFNQFNNEQKVAQTIRDNAPESGLYLLPDPYATGMSVQQKNKQNDLFVNGPVMFASVQLGGVTNMSWSFVLTFFAQVIAAYCITWMLMKTKGLRYMQQVGFVTLAAFVVGLLGILPGWFWKGFPGCYVFFCTLDLVIAWFLAGLAIAKLLRNTGHSRS